jgi:hypothetical protein
MTVLGAVFVSAVGCAPWLVTSSHLAGTQNAVPAEAAVEQTSLDPTDEKLDPKQGNDDETGTVPDAVDLYGNEVTEAVAKYQLDASGMLYELHSPQTEVPRLKPPKT